MADLLRIEGVKKHFASGGGIFGSGVFGGGKTLVRAVDGVSLSVARGEVCAVVGESGCGKSTLARLALRLLDPTAGKVYFDGQDVLAADKKAMKAIRRRMQVIFQDPFASLNPRMRVIDAVGEPLVIHEMARGDELRRQVLDLLQKVGLPADAANRYPHEFSGGQRQRICIARALALSPELIVADEPLSALDVSIQAQILNLLEDLRRERNLAYLFISHDLHVVNHFSDRVAVMYLGVIVEQSDTEALFAEPLHPYTEALLSAVPEPDPAKRRVRIILQGDVPRPTDIPPGCRFHTRCPKRFEPCDKVVPELREVGTNRIVACHLWSR
ncbi:MAG: ATP-binding cassette domain-containing protein [Nitrospirae bacterium]|nr:ATP-binding cassette domain-containing protein [Nitrospirota bacterium]